MEEGQIQVFISSRGNELKEEREAVEYAVVNLWNNEKLPFKYWSWENAKESPSGKQADDVQTEGVKNSDIYVLILGEEYGNFEYGESPTHKEYNTACSEVEEDCILIYVEEVDEREDKLDQWIGEIKKKHTYKHFRNVDHLHHLVETKLRDLWYERNLNSIDPATEKAKIIHELYKKFWFLDDNMRILTSPVEYEGEPSKDEMLKSTWEILEDFVTFYKQYRIDLPKRTCDVIDDIIQKLNKAWIAMSQSWAVKRKGDPCKWLEASNICIREIPQLREELEEEFRNLLEVE